MTDRTTPAQNAVAITTSDSVNFIHPCRGVYVGGAGDINAVMGSAAVLFSNVAAGSVLPIEPVRINSTNTTATNLIAMW